MTRINRFECSTYRKAILIAFGLLVIILMLLIFSRQLTGTTLEKLSEAAAPRIMDTYGRLPLAFEVNRGQTDLQVKYLSRGRGYGLFLTPGEVVLVARKSHSKQSAGSNRLASRHKKTDHAESTTSTILRMRLMGANPTPGVIGVEQLPGRNHYFIGNNPNKWIRNIPQYARVKYGGIYPGVDLIFYGNQKQLEYDFVVDPGADPGVIRIKFAGMDKLSLDDNGNLALQIGNDRIIMRAPVIYQEINNQKQRVAGHYVLCKTGEVGFNVAPYDVGKPVVIDPVLVYSTYLGGNSSESGNGITLDADGNAYVTGSTFSSDFPTAPTAGTPAPFKGTLSGGSDAFVTKMNAEGSALVYSTYLGGSGNDEGLGIAIDSNNNIYITGNTLSTDFPIQSPVQLTNGGSPDAFVAKLNSSGSALVYSTYLGGSSDDYGQGIAVDSSGNAYVTGRTNSSDFPTAGTPVQGSLGGGWDAFVTKIDSEGTAPFIYSTYLGGSFNDYGQGIAVDSSDNACVTGSTFSSDFPMVPGDTPFRDFNKGGSDAFVTKLNSVGSDLLYSTYLGGTNNDEGLGIALDTSDNACVTGSTFSSDFPMVPGDTPFRDFNKGGSDAFVTKLNSVGSDLLYSTYLGGTNNDEGLGIALDTSDNACVTGSTFSPDFPTESPIQNSMVGEEAFVTKLNSGGSALLYSTFLGGNGDEEGLGIAVDSDNNVYVTGSTLSTNFPTENPVQSTNSGSNDAFIARFDSTGSSLIYSSYLGGGLNDYGKGIAVDSSGNAYVTGSTFSSGSYSFPTAGTPPFQDSNGGGSDAFITKSSTKDITPAPSPPDGGGGGGGCFIATASYGSNMADEVMILREFRDRYLLTNSTGRKFVKCYYRYSPPVARYIERNDAFRTAARISLLPVVYSIKYPYITFGIFLTVVLVTIRRQRKDKY